MSGTGHGSSVYDWLLIFAVLAPRSRACGRSGNGRPRSRRRPGCVPRPGGCSSAFSSCRSPSSSPARRDHLARPELSGFNFTAASTCATRSSRSGSRCRSTPAPSSPRTCAPASSRSRGADRGRLFAGPPPGAHDEPRDPAAGAAGHHAAADLAVPQPDQELLARHRGGLHGRPATLGGITINQTGRELEGMLLLMALLPVASLIDLAVMNVYNSSDEAEGALR
jgi:hypothetical protein